MKNISTLLTDSVADSGKIVSEALTFSTSHTLQNLIGKVGTILVSHLVQGNCESQSFGLRTHACSIQRGASIRTVEVGSNHRIVRRISIVLRIVAFIIRSLLRLMVQQFAV